MESRLQRFESIVPLSAEDWSAATPDATLWSSRQWLHSVENAFSAKRRYVIGPNGSMAVYPVAAGTFPHFDPHLLLTAESFVGQTSAHRDQEEQARLADLIGRLPEDVLRPATVAVVPWGFRGGLWAADEPTRSLLVTELERLGQEWETPTTGVMYVGHQEVALRESLLERGYLEVLVAGESVLSLDFPGFDDYLAGMHGTRRTKMRREIRAFARTGITFRDGRLSEEIKPIAELAAALQVKYGDDYDPERQEQLLLNIERTTSPYQHVILADDPQGRLVGFLVYFDKDGVIYPKMGGFDTAGKGQDYLYFNLGYYEMIRRALGSGAKEINYGIEVYDAKVMRGCALERLYCYFRVPPRHTALLTELAELVSVSRERALATAERLSPHRPAST